MNFSDVIFKMAAWQPYLIFQFLDSNFSLAFNIKSKVQLHITFVYWMKHIDFHWCHFQNGRVGAILIIFPLGYKTYFSPTYWKGGVS